MSEKKTVRINRTSQFCPHIQGIMMTATETMWKMRSQDGRKAAPSGKTKVPTTPSSWVQGM